MEAVPTLPGKVERWLMTPWEEDGNVLRAYVFDFTQVTGLCGEAPFERIHITVSKFKMLQHSPDALGKLVKQTHMEAMDRLRARRKEIIEA